MMALKLFWWLHSIPHLYSYETVESWATLSRKALHVFQFLSQRRSKQSRLLRVMSSQVLRISKDGDDTTLLGNLVNI